MPNDLYVRSLMFLAIVGADMGIDCVLNHASSNSQFEISSGLYKKHVSTDDDRIISM
jgi:hypothetical protein